MANNTTSYKWGSVIFSLKTGFSFSCFSKKCSIFSGPYSPFISLKGFTMINVGPTLVKVLSKFNLFFKLNKRSTSLMSFVAAISSTFIVSPFIICKVSLKKHWELSVNVTIRFVLSIDFTFFLK